MKRMLNNQSGVTLIETVAATAIIMIILVTILGALMFGQKMVVFSDSKNNEAAQAQELIDDIMAQLSANTDPDYLVTGNATKRDGGFVNPDVFSDPKPATDLTRQYIVEEDVVKQVINGNTIEYIIYNIKVRVYYNNDNSYIDLKAFVKKGSVFV